ncbi:MAG: hypothetical protein MZV64_19165 [Ignavibacteriales bacterium]|nr:hypothetical protein [Ignavibacteriales bacterium]
MRSIKRLSLTALQCSHSLQGRFCGIGIRAIDRFRQKTRERGLARSARTREEIGMLQRGQPRWHSSSVVTM